MLGMIFVILICMMFTLPMVIVGVLSWSYTEYKKYSKIMEDEQNDEWETYMSRR